MNLYCENILDFYTIQNTKVLCLIKVNCKSRKSKKSCRSFLSQDQWLAFDRKLEKILIATDILSDEKKKKFAIRPYIKVEVRKSKLKFNHFFKLLNAIGHYCEGKIAELIDRNLVLECLIDFHQEVPLSSCPESQEYEPLIDPSADSKLLLYEPYTPSNTKLYDLDKICSSEDTDINFLECNEDTYCPKPIFPTTESNLIQEIPKYTPAPINDGIASKEGNKTNFLNDVEYKIDGDFNYSKQQHKPLTKQLSKKSRKKQHEYIPKSYEVATPNVPIYIPTPIQETATQNAFQIDNIRKIKRRSNTIDVFPEHLHDNIEEKQIPELGQVADEENIIHGYNKALKKRSMTIDEFPAALADVPVYSPTPQEILKVVENEKVSTSMDDLPEKVDENTKENHVFEKERMDCARKYYHGESKNLRKRSITMDETPVVLVGSNNLHTLKSKLHYLNEQFSKMEEKVKPSEKKPEKSVVKLPTSLKDDELLTSLTKRFKKTSQSTLIKNDMKPQNDFKIDKNLSAIDTHVTKTIKSDKILKVSSTETMTSSRQPERLHKKQKKFTEEQPDGIISNNKNKKTKTSPKNKELFGTDDDDEELGLENCNAKHLACSDKKLKLKSTFFETHISKKLSNSPDKRKHKTVKYCKNGKGKSEICRPYGTSYSSSTKLVSPTPIIDFTSMEEE